MLATTATANARVTRDVADQLGASASASASAGRETLVLRGPLDRDSLRLAVVALPTAHQRLGWLAARLGELPGSGIVYALTVAAAQETAAFLREQGLTVAAYTGRDEPDERARAEDDLLANRVKALVATSALGMGFDSRISASSCTWARRSHRSPTTSRSGGPGGRCRASGVSTPR